jgi:hypothetical protein
LLGDDELGRSSAIVRNMETKAQEEVPLTALLTTLKNRLSDS